MFLVAAGVLKRNLQAAPVAAVPFRRIYREHGVGRASVQPDIEIGTNLEIAVLTRLRKFRTVSPPGYSQAKKRRKSSIFHLYPVI